MRAVKTCEYGKLRQDAKDELCASFAKTYPDVSVVDIHEVLIEINPAVEWDDDPDSRSGYSVWEIHRERFERLLEERHVGV